MGKDRDRIKIWNQHYLQRATNEVYKERTEKNRRETDIE